MSDKFYVGLSLMGFEKNGIQRPISRVTLLLDDENVLTAGDDSGLELTADCPHAAQAMVNSLLAQLKGSQYKMYGVTDARLDPSAELGDGITAEGVYSVISRLADDGMGFPSPSAPGKEELEDEFPAGGPMTQAFDRKISETRSSITKTAEQIRLEIQKIENDVTTLSTSFTVELGKITSDIQDINGNYSRLEQTINGFSLSVNNGETSSTIELKSGEAIISSQTIKMNGLVTFEGLAGGTTTINGGCLKTGTIQSIKIDSSEITGGTITGSSIRSVGIDESSVSRPLYYIFLDGGKLSFFHDAYRQGDIKSSTASGGIEFYSDYAFRFYVKNQPMFQVSDYTAGFNTNEIEQIFCNNDIELGTYQVLHTSDARLKKNIQKSDMDALSVINSMKTYSFDWEKDGSHEKLGFIAQQLEKVNPDFVNISPADGHYSVKEMKIIPYLVKAVQELSEKIEKLEGDSQ